MFEKNHIKCQTENESDYYTCIVLHFTTKNNENSLITMCQAFFFFSNKVADICTGLTTYGKKNLSINLCSFFMMLQ